MADFMLNIITPEKIFFEGEVNQVIVRTDEGDIGILAHHISLVANLPSGPIRIKTGPEEWKTAALSTGLIKVGNNKVNIFANAVEWAEDIDVDWAKKSAEAAKEKLAQQQSKREMDLAELKLKRALNRLSVHEKFSGVR